MSELIQIQIESLNKEIAIWNNFSNAILELNDEDVIAKGLEYDRMVWTSNKVDYYIDYTSLDSITQLLAKKGGLVTEVKYYVPNYNVRKGIESCIEYINVQIENLQRAVEGFKKNIKNK